MGSVRSQILSAQSETVIKNRKYILNLIEIVLYLATVKILIHTTKVLNLEYNI